MIVDDLKVHPPVGHRRADDEVRAEAVERLAHDPRIRSTHVHVKVLHSHVTLTGYVRHEAESEAAAEDAAATTGVVGTTNRIEIR